MKFFKNKKIKIFSIIVIVLVVALFFVGIYRNFYNPVNVFDEMYVEQMFYAENNYLKEIILNKKKHLRFGNIRVWNEKTGSIEYSPEYLKNEKERLTISFDKKNNLLNFSYSLILDQLESLSITYNYSLEKKELIISPLLVNTPESQKSEGFVYTDEFVYVSAILNKYNLAQSDIEEMTHYVFYEKILPDWFETNGSNSKFSMDNLGDFTIVDNTFQNLDI